jgi:hypothetical protein
MRQRTLDRLLTGLTVAISVAALIGLVALGNAMTGWMEHNLMSPLIAGIRSTLLLPGSF